MTSRFPESRGWLRRANDRVASALLVVCTSSRELDPDSKLEIRRQKLFGLVPWRDSTSRDGRAHGVVVWHALRGDVRLRQEFADGVPNGAFREWHGNGVKALECSYAGGVLHGKATAWRRDGTKRFVGEYRQGAKTGEWFYLERDGKLDRERTGLYVDGVRLSGIKGFNEWLGSP